MNVDKIFQNGCVLQRRKKVSIWGEASEGETITVLFAGQKKTVLARTGRWAVELEPMETLRNQTLIISNGEDSLKITDVAVGEVWLAGGQSNMEFWLCYDRDFQDTRSEKIAKLDIRYYDCAKAAYEDARKESDFSNYEFWRKCTAEDLNYYSAVAFWFAKKLQEELTVPVGIIGCNYGGSRACSWMDEETVINHGKVWLDEYEGAIQNLDMDKYIAEIQKNPFFESSPGPFSKANVIMFGDLEPEVVNDFLKDLEAPPTGPRDAWRPCGLYRNMLETIIPYTLAGVLWYQGESDDLHPELYKDMLSGMIGLWRTQWKEDLPFLIVQLAPFGEDSMGSGKKYPVIRTAQRMVTEKTAKTWLVSTSDCGDAKDIHPRRKRLVGERLALQALHYIYGKEILSEAPECVACVRQMDTLVLKFINVGDGIFLRQGEFDWLVIRQGSRTLSWSLKEIGKDSLILKLDGVDEGEKVSVSIAQSGYYKMNLYNSAWIPAIPSEVTEG